MCTPLRVQTDLFSSHRCAMLHMPIPFSVSFLSHHCEFRLRASPVCFPLSLSLSTSPYQDPASAFPRQPLICVYYLKSSRSMVDYQLDIPWGLVVRTQAADTISLYQHAYGLRRRPLLYIQIYTMGKYRRGGTRCGGPIGRGTHNVSECNLFYAPKCVCPDHRRIRGSKCGTSALCTSMLRPRGRPPAVGMP